MGRTVAAFSLALADYYKDLKPFRRQLDPPEQKAFDQMFESVRPHTYAAVYMGSPDPSTPIILSMMLEMHKRIDNLEERLAILQKRLEDLK